MTYLFLTCPQHETALSHYLKPGLRNEILFTSRGEGVYVISPNLPVSRSYTGLYVTGGGLFNIKKKLAHSPFHTIRQRQRQGYVIATMVSYWSGVWSFLFVIPLFPSTGQEILRCCFS